MNIAHRDFGADKYSATESLEKGFTLVELIIVIALLGILSIYAASRLFSSADFTARGFHDETLSYLRFAHQTAIAHRRVVCVTFTPNSLTMNIASAPEVAVCDTALRGPTGESPATLIAKAGASYKVQPDNFNFDALGRPVNASGGLVGSQNIEVSGSAIPLVIETETGFVHE